MIILRHDIDNPFLNHLLLKAESRIHLPRYSRLLRRPLFGYLKHLNSLLNKEHELGIKSSWFFRASTKPYRELAEMLSKNGHEIAFHADRIQNVEQFRYDLSQLTRWKPVLGFSKHGHKGLFSDGRGEGEVYNQQLCMQRAKEFGMKYFTGNKPFCNSEFALKNDGVFLFPYLFIVEKGYIDSKFTVDWLIKNKDLNVVVNIHPEDMMRFPDDVNKIYEKCADFATFQSALKKF